MRSSLQNLKMVVLWGGGVDLYNLKEDEDSGFYPLEPSLVHSVPSHQT